MKKVGIITINDNDNYGNRLQNYALQSKIKDLGFYVETVKNDIFFNNVENKKDRFIHFLRYLKKKGIFMIKCNKFRLINFNKFNKKIKFSSKMMTTKNCFQQQSNYDYFVVGSDQVWKPLYLRLSEIDLLFFTEHNKKISYAASFGIDSVTEKDEKKITKYLSDFKCISVREDSGKKIINKCINNDVEVLIDPVMLLNTSEWNKVIKKPKQYNGEKYILNYFLGNLSDSRKQEIDRIAKENNYKIINILDKNNPFYVSGPSEFLWLEKNAELICTDSFHSSVFALIYNRPFIIFNREQKGMNNMNSRIETLISKFDLKNRKYNGKEITAENLNHDYTESYRILEKEKEKAIRFLKKALDIEEE